MKGIALIIRTDPRQAKTQYHAAVALRIVKAYLLPVMLDASHSILVYLSLQ